MKQICQSQGLGRIAVEEVPAPVLRPGGVLVRTVWSLISAGTERAKLELAQKSLAGKALARPEQARQVIDALRQQGLAATYRKVTNRLDSLEPLGYSCSGVVLAAGAGAEDFTPGDAVACAGAGYANHAEVNFVPRNLCVRIPDALELDEAAFATAGAIAMQGVRQAEARLGEAVAVIGLGLIGLLTVQILKAAGCRVLGVDLDAERRRLAGQLGAEAAAPPDAALVLTLASAVFGLPGCDAAIVTAATSSDGPLELAGRLCRDRGRVVVVGNVGMKVPRQVFYEKELDLRLSRSYGPGRYDPDYEEKGRDYPLGYVRWTERRNLEAFLALAAGRKIDLRPLITHRFPIQDAPAAYALIQGGEPCLGVLLAYPSATPPNTTPPRITRRHTEPRPSGSGPRPLVRLGFLGAGNFAQDTLLPALQSLGQVRFQAVATASGLSAVSVARRFGFARAAADAADLLLDPEIDAVVIATRHDAHAALVIDALKANRHVFVEKPLAVRPEELEAIAAALRSLPNPPLLMVGFNRRFAPAVRVAREFFASNSEPLCLRCRVNAGYLPPANWLHDPETGGGRITGEGCHFVDLALHLAGSRPVQVFAQALPDGGRYRHDNVSLQIRFANGSLATVDYLANGDKRLPKEAIEIFGGGAAAIIDDFRRVTLARHGKLRRLGHWWSGPDKGHRAELKAFIEAVRRGGPSPVPFDEAARSMRVTFRLLDALRAGLPVPA
jgi:polar amino acid transport system substrate-binding protein